MKRNKWNVIALFLIAILFALLALGSREISLTSDEPAHIAAGYALLARGKDAFWTLPQHGHPPLLNVLEALLLYIEKPDTPLEQLDGWPLWLSNYIRAFAPYLSPPERTEVIARMPIIFLTVLLGALIFRWGKEWWTPRTGLIALLIVIGDPLLLAHGRLATTDVGTVTLGTAALFLTWRWIEHPSWRMVWPAGVLLGLTMLAKGSGILWVIAVGLIVLGAILQLRRGSLWLPLTQGICIPLISFFVLWAGYAFTWGPVRQEFPFSLPAPDHWNGIISQALSVEKRWVYALEMRRHGGWWWYFPMAFIIKNPLPLLIALGIGLVILGRRPVSWKRLLILGLFPVIYTAAAIQGKMNIGYRHMLPIHPAIYLVAAAGIDAIISRTSRHFWKTALLSVIGIWYFAGTLRMFGYEIAFFNELIGGPQNGHRYLIDSNIDWGQGYKALREYLEEHPGPVPKIAYSFANYDPGLYGIPFEALPPEITANPLPAPFHPLPGRYIISITSLKRGWPEDPDMYAWFREIEPTARIGYSFFVYDINPPPLGWIGQCTTPTVPLSDAVIAWGFGTNTLRRIEFDCTNAWIYPNGREVPGVYGFHHSLVPEGPRSFLSLLPPPPQPRDPFLARRLNGARLSLNMQRYTEQFNPFVLYEQERAIPYPPNITAVVPAQATSLPDTMTDTIEAPVALNGPLTFLGVGMYPSKGEIEVESWWQITEGPITRPLSIMGHLLNGKGELLGQNDGLGIPPVVWQPGDIIVQRHRFPRPPDGTELWLRTGAYWLDTMERWSVAGMTATDTLWVDLGQMP